MKSKILIVEDESIEAMSFEQSLKSFGYNVVGIFTTAEEAIKKIAHLEPDLILMDIVLRGEMDGIDAAGQIKDKFDIPVIYLTAHPEKNALNRAKLTSPYGYITKPVNKKVLKNAIELALYKHKMEIKLKKSEKFYRRLFENMLEGFAHCKLLFDKEGNPEDWIYLDVNKSFEQLTGLKNIIGKRVMQVIPEIKDLNPELFEIYGKVACTGQPESFEIFFKPLGIWLDVSVFSPTKEHFVAVFQDITQRKTSEERINRLYRLYATLSQINQSVVRIKDINRLFKAICEVCVEFGKFRMAWIGLIDRETGEIRPVEHNGHEDGYLSKISINVGEQPSLNKPTTLAINTGKVIITEDIKKELKRGWINEALKRDYRSLASIPLKSKGEVIGNFNIYSSEPDFFTEEEINLAEEIGTDISYAIDSIESEKKLARTSKALSESEKSYRDLVDNSMVAVYKTNLKGEILFANHAMARIFHFKSIEDLKTKNITELYLNPADREKAMEKLKKEGFFRQYELNMISNTGKRIDIILSANLVDDIISGMIMDITERTKAERVLRESEEKFKALIHKSTDLIRILDKNGLIIFDSPSSRRILGYPPGYFIGKNPLDFIHPADLIRVKNDLKEVYENRNPGIPTEFRTLKSDGNYVPVESVAQNLTDVPGIEGIVVTTHPVIEQKKVEKALRESQRLLANIIDFLPDATFAINREGKVIAWNRVIEKMTGILKEDMMDEGNYAYAIPWYGERRPILIDLIGLGDSEFSLKYDFIRKKGQTLTAEVFVPSVYGGRGAYLWVKASPLLDNKGQQYGAIESVRDITERKKSEFALQRSEERFRAVAESAVDAIITTDVDGKVLFCNNSLESIFGYPREEIIGKKLTVLMPDRFKEDYMKGLELFKASGEHIRVGKTLKTTGLRKDGTEFPFEMSLSSWKSGDKNFFTSILRDITEREKAEDQIKKSLKEKEILLKEIHHRVKNNLQIISSLLDLQETYVKEDPTAVNVLMESQNRVLSMAMIHEMLYQSKDLSNINFSEYIRSLVTSLFHTYGVKSRIDVVINVGEHFLNVETSVPLGLIVSELVSNSLKYAFPHAKTGELLVSIKCRDRDFELVIGDDGVGFPENTDFKNVKSSLGLQLVNSLVNQLDGTIELDRSHGTQFTIKFKELKYQERV